MAVTLAHLMGGKRADGSVKIAGLTVDSRAVRQGDMFVALPGNKLDGRHFIADAVKAGAAAVLTTPDAEVSSGTPVVEDHNPRRRYADLSARFYGAQPATQVAVTGTNGKTSVADFTRQIWTAIGLEAASVGTLGVCSKPVQRPGGLTTPDPMALHEVLKSLADAGVGHAALEASSHGLDQYRLDGVRFKAAAFTNLTRDHLDYHRTEQGYFYAKARLFGELVSPGDGAVINVDSHWGRVLDDIAWARGLERLSLGAHKKAALRILDQQVDASGQRISFSFEGARYEYLLPLVGAFQAENVLLAAGLVIATGGKPADVFASLEGLKGVPGRMELVGVSKTGGSVFVDYAHTPDGLSTVLKAARAHKPKALHVVFGCGGDRDKGKRPEMGAIASDLADHVIVTDDNPRSENAATIRREILAATSNMDGVQIKEIGDRAAAIEAAISGLKAGDMLVVAGKGHEEGQLVGDKILPFSDIETVKTIVACGG